MRRGESFRVEEVSWYGLRRSVVAPALKQVWTINIIRKCSKFNVDLRPF